jgi:hypothetical protein
VITYVKLYLSPAIINMHGNAAYQYLTVTCTTEETSSIHSTFSKFAKANENWAEISDRAERRRIQNRISQRKYRKKLKKRLEDLVSTSAATPPITRTAY